MSTPLMTIADGATRWTLDNLPHREDGPAIIHDNGTMLYFIHGKHHRIDGPAVISVMAKKPALRNFIAAAFARVDHSIFQKCYIQYWIYGKNITSEVVQWLSENRITDDWGEWTELEKTHFALRFR